MTFPWPWRPTTPDQTVWNSTEACHPTGRPVFTLLESSGILTARRPPSADRKLIFPTTAQRARIPKPPRPAQPATLNLQVLYPTRPAPGRVRKSLFLQEANSDTRNNVMQLDRKSTRLNSS